jgi:hypothetical protein
VPEPPTTTLNVDQYLDDAEWSYDQDSAAIRILGGDVKVDRFIMHDYVPQSPLYSHWTLREARLQGAARRRLLRNR